MTGFAWIAAAVALLVVALVALAVWLLWPADDWNIDADEFGQDSDDYDRLTGAPW